MTTKSYEKSAIAGAAAPPPGPLERRRTPTGLTPELEVAGRDQLLHELSSRITSLELLQSIAASANATDSVAAALAEAIDRICAHMEWPAGHAFFVPDTQPDRALPTSIWFLSDAERFQPFRARSDSLPFSRGVGMIGEVLHSGRPVWVEDVTKDPTFVRSAEAQAVGLRGALAFPVLAGADVAAVLEFFSFRPEPPDERTAQLMGSMGTVLGRVVERDRAIREREARYEFLAQAIPQQVWTADPDGQLDFLNHRALSYCGCTLSEMAGVGWFNLIHPADRRRAAEQWRLAVSTGERFQEEVRVRRSDGQYRWHLTRAVARLGRAGRVVKWFGTNTEVHDLKEAEAARDRALAQARVDRARLRQVLMQAPAAICVLRGRELELETANCRFLELIGNRDVLGKSLVEALPEARPQGMLAALEQVYATGEPYIGVEERLEGISGPDDERYFNFVYQPLFDAGEYPTGIVIHALDVSGQVRARQQVERQVRQLGRLTDALKRSNEDLDQFAYVASHDLKAPLRGIATISDWLEEDLADRLPPQSAEHLERLRGRVKRMEGLIDGLLAYSRAGHHREAPQEVRLREVVAEVLDLLAPPPELQIDLAPDLPTLHTERLPLQQVLQNLLGNAIKHTDADDPQIQVGWEDAGQMVRLWVTDNGPGIAPRYHDKIWRIFLTLRARDEVEGTGIGLSLVKKMVERRGGKVWVESEPGHGATFQFLWPKRTTGDRA